MMMSLARLSLIELNGEIPAIDFASLTYSLNIDREIASMLARFNSPRTDYARMFVEFQQARARQPWRALDIALAVCLRHFGITRAEIISEDRHPQASEIRQRAMAFVRVVTDANYSQIGRAFNRHHSAAALACEKFEREIRAAIGSVKGG